MATINLIQKVGTPSINGLSATTGRNQVVSTSKYVTSGKWYWEVEINTLNSYKYIGIGVCSSSATSSTGDQSAYVWYDGDIRFYLNNAIVEYTQYTPAISDKIGVVLDADNKTIQFFFENGLFSKKHDISSLSDFSPMVVMRNAGVTSSYTFNFGETEFSFFKAHKDIIEEECPEMKLVSFNEDVIVNYYNKVLLKSNNKIYSLKSNEILYETKMTSNTAPAPFAASASSTFSSTYPAWKAFNGTVINDADTWLTASGASTGWIQIDFGTPRISNKIQIWSKNGVLADVNQSPKDFNILGSNDGINFTTIRKIRNQTNWGVGENRTFYLHNDTPYRQYRLQVISNNGSVVTAIGDIIFSYEENLTELLSDSVDNYIKYGSSSIENFSLINVNKNYILSPNEGNTGGLFEQQISRKPLTISSTNKLAILHDGTYYTSTDGLTLTPLTNESEVETLGFNSLTLSQEIYNLIGVNPTVVAFSNTEDDIAIETTTEPFTLYDEFGDEVEVLFYTDDDTITDADLILEANWSPLDELDGNFEVVTWTDETDSTRTLEMSAIPKPQFIRKSTVSDIFGTLNGIIANTTSSNVRFLLTNNNSTWYKWNGSNFENVNYTSVDEILNLGNTYDELTNADYSKWTHSKINVGVFLMDDNNATSKISELGIVENSPVNTSQVSNLNFYILNTTAKIDLDLKGLWLSGHLSDLDLTRVQYRVFLNNQPYFPLSGEFTNLADPPLNIDITFRSDEIKINDWNTLRVEFKDYFGTMDYWQTTFVGNYSSLMFMDTDGNYYSDDVGKVLQYLDFGTFFGGQYSLEHEVIVKNQYGYDVKNVMIEANTGHLPEGVDVQFSDTIDPFIPQSNLILPNELKDNEQVSFYIRMISDIDSVPNGENKFDIFVKAERKV